MQKIPITPPTAAPRLEDPAAAGFSASVSGCVAAIVSARGSCVQLQLLEYELAGHIRHAVADVAPTDTEYVPALQLMHVDADLAPSETEYVPALQLMHVDADVAPTETEYVPTLQLMHSEVPTPAYLPASCSVRHITLTCTRLVI